MKPTKKSNARDTLVHCPFFGSCVPLFCGCTNQYALPSVGRIIFIFRNWAQVPLQRSVGVDRARPHLLVVVSTALCLPLSLACRREQGRRARARAARPVPNSNHGDWFRGIRHEEADSIYARPTEPCVERVSPGSCRGLRNQSPQFAVGDRCATPRHPLFSLGHALVRSLAPISRARLVPRA